MDQKATTILIIGLVLIVGYVLKLTYEIVKNQDDESLKRFW
jgi:hypothetical protein